MKNNEYATKNDFIFFQNEILGDVKKIEIKITERLNAVTSILETQKFLVDKNNEELKSMIQNIANEKNGTVNLEPFENKLKESIKSVQELSSKLEIKFNILNRDFNNACYRYDKAISSNLIIPGVIGYGCPYENLRAFLEFINIKLIELNRDKEKSTLDTKLYKEKLENLIKSNQKQLETMEFKMKDVFRRQLASNDNLFKDRITEVYNKIETDKNLNEKVLNQHEKMMNDQEKLINDQEKLINDHELVINENKLNLDKIVKDFDKFYDEDWEKLNNLVKELNNNIAKNNEQILALNNKTNEIEDLIKKIQTNNSHNRNNCRNSMHKENSQSSEIKNSKVNSLNNSKTLQKEENKKSDENSKKILFLK